MATVYLSWGMGVESTAILLRWILEPASRVYAGDDGRAVPFSLDDLVVVTAQTGDEHDDTRRDCERHILPLLRREGIRLVQLARAGHNEADGVAVLDDTREPWFMHTEGAYRLSDELKAAGTIPQSGGEHRCALKFKAWVIDVWLGHDLAGRRAVHAFGYNADERPRVAKSEAAIAAALRPRARAEVERERPYAMAFGFNLDEPARVERSRVYDRKLRPRRVGVYPLVEWGWSREACERYIALELGVAWRKSACVYCPFNELVARETASGLGRLFAHGARAAEALLLERVSLALNPRASLFRRKALAAIVARSAETDPAAAEVLGLYGELLDSLEWAVYRVRRVYRGPGAADRMVEREVYPTRAEAEAALERVARALGVAVDADDLTGTRRAVVVAREGETAAKGAREEFYVAAPATAEEKTRYGAAWFDARWAAADPGPALGLGA